MSKKPQPPPADYVFDANRPTSPPPPRVPGFIKPPSGTVELNVKIDGWEYWRVKFVDKDGRDIPE